MDNPSFNNNATPWFAISMGLIGVIVGYIIAMVMGGTPLRGGVPTIPSPTPSPSAVPSVPTPAPAAGEVEAPDPDVDHIYGDADAEISVIEWSDFECPFCSRVHPTIKGIVDSNEGKVNWVYRHFPLGMHPNAQPAAEASECVAEQGGNDAFWEFADAIFANQGDWNYESKVKTLGLDVDAFKNCFESKKFMQHVQSNMAAGSAAGVQGTPGNVVYNNKTKESRMVSGAQPAASFQAAIDALLQ